MTDEFKRGARAAAAIADSYNGSTTHEYRLGDCVLGKLNVTRREKPRKNKKAIPNQKASFAQGMALALAEVHRIGGHSTAVREVANAAGLTIAELKQAGVDQYDWRELKKAGVP